MKRLLIVAIMALCSSCAFLQESCSLGHSRTEAMSGAASEKSAVETDTLIFVCAVETPSEYDWQKDVSMGLCPGKLLFYKNHKLDLEQQIGYSYAVSSDADTHHIIGGHLFTEFSQADKTVIKKDGELLLEFSARECLSGLIEEDGVTHTLGIDRNTGALTYRRDGIVIYSCQDAYSFGSFQEPTYPDTGALYLSDGKICFCYARKIDNIIFYHMVKDGVDNQLVLSDDHFYYGVQDIRAINGNVYVVSALSSSGFVFGTASSARYYGRNYNWSSLRISVNGDKPSVFGKISEASRPLGYAVVSSDGRIKTVGYEEAVCFDGKIFDVTHEDCVHFSNRTCCMAGSVFMEALTPKDMNKNPFLKSEGEVVNYKIHGYITGLSVELSQSKSEFLCRPERR